VAKEIDVVKGKGHQAEIDLGDGTRQFSTHYNHSYTNKHSQVDQKRIGKDEISKMRAENFVNGFAGKRNSR